MRRSYRLAQHGLAELLGLTVGELRRTMTLAEFISWQAYFKTRQAEQAKPPPLPELGALGPAGIAQALR